MAVSKLKPLVALCGHPLLEELQAMVDEAFHVVRLESLDQHRRKEVEAVVVLNHTEITGDFLDSLPSLKVVSNHGVGYDHIDVSACKSREVRVGTTPRVLDGTVADMAFALLLAAARRVVEGDRISKDLGTEAFNTNWFGYQVSGSTLGIVGMGNIGHQIARRACGFDMHVLYHNRNRRPREVEEAVSATYEVSLHGLLRQSDFVVIAVPATKENVKMLGAAEFSVMKKGAVFINISRGSLVDHDALAESLASGTLAAAGLDVTAPEPLPRDHLLLALPNVTITPHTGSATLHTRRKMVQMVIDNVFCALKGETMPNEVIS